MDDPGEKTVFIRYANINQALNRRLLDQSQTTKLHVSQDCQSAEWRSVSAGVPQGTKTGSLALPIIEINELDTSVDL